MQFLRTLFWVVFAVFVAIMARNNWSDVTVNLWGSLQADIKLPLLLLIAVLAGFLPTYLVYRTRLWRARRRVAVQQPAVVTTTNPSASEEGEDFTRAPAQ